MTILLTSFSGRLRSRSAANNTLNSREYYNPAVDLLIYDITISTEQVILQTTGLFLLVLDL